MKFAKTEKLTDLKGTWHDNVTVKIRHNVSFNITSVQSGCGAVNISNYVTGVGRSNIEVFKEFFKELLNNLKVGNYKCLGSYTYLDVGMIETTLGQGYYNTWLPVFEELGFKEIIEYPNPRHSGEKQCLLVWVKY